MANRQVVMGQTDLVVDGQLVVRDAVVNEGISKVTTDIDQTKVNLQTLTNDQEAILSDLSDLESDSKLTPSEKLVVKREWDNLVAEYPIVLDRAVAHGVTAGNAHYDAFVTAYNDLDTYLNPAILGDLGTTTDIVGGTLRAKFSTYFTEREDLLEAVAGVIDTAIDGILSELSDLESDSKLTPSEKLVVKREWDIVAAEYPVVKTRAQQHGITTGNAHYDAYVTAYNALNAYLNTNPTGVIYSLTTTTDIVGGTLRSNFASYFTEREDLLEAVAGVIDGEIDDRSTYQELDAGFDNAYGTTTPTQPTGEATAGFRTIALRCDRQVDLRWIKRYEWQVSTNGGATWYSLAMDGSGGGLGTLGGVTIAYSEEIVHSKLSPETLYTYHVRRVTTQDDASSYSANIAATTGIIVTADLDEASVVAATLADESVETEKIAPAAVITSKLAVVTRGKSINIDPNIDDASIWQPSGFGTVSIVTDTSAPCGDNALTSAAAKVYVCDQNYYPLDTSKTYRVRFWAKRSADANGKLYFCLRQWIAPGNACATNNGRSPYQPNSETPPTTWAEYSYEWNAVHWQSGVRFVTLDWLLNYTGTVGKMYVQGVRFEEVLPAVLIQDGAIIAGKIAAGVVTSNEIAAGTILASNIHADTLNTLIANINEYLTISDTGGWIAGVYSSPSEGDERVYMDRDELVFQRWISGAWADRIRLGNVDGASDDFKSRFMEQVNVYLPYDSDAYESTAHTYANLVSQGYILASNEAETHGLGINFDGLFSTQSLRIHAASDFNIRGFSAVSDSSIGINGGATITFLASSGNVIIYPKSGGIVSLAGNTVLSAGFDLTLTLGDLALTNGDVILTSGDVTTSAGWFITSSGMYHAGDTDTSVQFAANQVGIYAGWGALTGSSIGLTASSFMVTVRESGSASINAQNHVTLNADGIIYLVSDYGDVVMQTANGGTTFATFRNVSGGVKVIVTDYTIDASGDIILDAGGADVILKDAGVIFGSLSNVGGQLVIKSGSTPTIAITFSGANATFAGWIDADAGVRVDNITIDGTEIDLSSGDLLLDVAGDIILDAGGADVILKDAGVIFGSLSNVGGQLVIKSGSTPTTAITLSGADSTFAGELDLGAAIYPYVQAHRDTAQTGIANSTYATVVFATEDIDSGADYNATTGEFTVPVSGLYQIQARVLFDSTAWPAGGQAEIGIWVGAALHAYGQRVNVEAALTCYMAVTFSKTVYLAAASVVTVRVLQASGGTINTYGSAQSGNHNWLTINRLVGYV